MSKRLALAASILLLAFPALAAEKPYITAKELDITIFLPPPAKAGSDADKAQMQAVLDAQKAASPERIALAKADGEESVYDMYTRTFGEGFKADAMPAATKLFARVGESEDETVDPAKPFFGRVRPFLANPEVKAHAKPSKSGAYPSGHTTRVTTVATILTSMVPEKREAIWARAAEYAQSRVVGGMHYPEDLDAGYRTGSALATAIMAHPEFKADYPAAKAEIRAFFGLK